ncbi:hypothetical protein SASPL_138588 [Salvia splendens]|uniref:Uncharacterized protein n=1 Tax=Salvia splendens TaxID=180675 RepID=A0A8X8WWY9_SALSN|nr:hypothetical protein SASPL_138588 [Salvia splendens]
MLRVSMATPLLMLGNYGSFSKWIEEAFVMLLVVGVVQYPFALYDHQTRLSISPYASSALAESRNSSAANFYNEALLYVAAEDEAFLAFNSEIDICSAHNERRDTSLLCDVKGRENVEAITMAEKNINEWLAELDAISREVEAELVSRDIGCHLAEVLEAVNKVLFESRGFRRSPVIVDPKCSYLHSALSSGCASEFLIWPPTENPEELFKVTSGHSLFEVVNGKCVDDPRSKASDINSHSLLGLEIATNRDIIGIALANLIEFNLLLILQRLYWKRASRTNHGLMLTSPLRSGHKSEEKFNQDGSPVMPLLRPQELRLAIMASERLLILQPHNWCLRRDYGMLLFYNREYEAAVQELSICMAFTPEEEAEVLEPFVEKLHLMRLETSWKSLGQKGRLTIP